MLVSYLCPNSSIQYFTVKGVCDVLVKPVPPMKHAQRSGRFQFKWGLQLSAGEEESVLCPACHPPPTPHTLKCLSMEECV